MISTQNLLFDRFAVRGTASIFSAAPPTLAATQTLLTIGCFAIPNYFRAATVAALHADVHHELQLTNNTSN